MNFLWFINHRNSTLPEREVLVDDPQYNAIRYSRGYKWQLRESWSVDTGIVVAEEINTPFMHLDVTGILTFSKGFSWDASGPTFDTKDTLRASLTHDGLYQLFQGGHLDPDVYRIVADQLLLSILKQDGVPWLRRRIWYKAVRIAGGGSARKPKKILTAP